MGLKNIPLLAKLPIFMAQAAQFPIFSGASFSTLAVVAVCTPEPIPDVALVGSNASPDLPVFALPGPGRWTCSRKIPGV